MEKIRKIPLQHSMETFKEFFKTFHLYLNDLIQKKGDFWTNTFYFTNTKEDLQYKKKKN